MRVGVVRETAPGERRVALVPETAGKLAAAGFDIVVEPGAGSAASFPDDAYTASGVALGSPWDADAVVAVRRPEVARLREGSLLIAYLDPLTDHDGLRQLAARDVTAFAMESIPRITRAQPMDALSSQATVVGLVAFYGGKAAADAIQRYGAFSAAGIAALVVVGWIVVHFGKRRLEEKL